MRPATHLVRQDDLAAKLYIERREQVGICDPYIGLIIERADRIVGAVILNDYTPERNIEITVHSSGNWSIRDVRDIARYCFQRVQRITARTSVNNSRAARMLEMLGFKREGVMRMFFKDGDAVIFGLLKSEQRIAKI